MPKIKGVFFCCTVVKSPQRKTKFYTFFQLKWLIYVKKLSSFSLFALCASDNLVHIILQLGTFHAQYTNHKNLEDFLLTLYNLYKETAFCITAGQC